MEVTLVPTLRRAAVLLIIVTLAGALPSFGASTKVQGAIAHKKLAYGEYVEYFPGRTPSGILVIAHGSVEEEKSEPDLRKLAEGFVRRWAKFADDHALIVVAPVFDHAFGSWIGERGIALGGYRGLEGKEIGADEFVHRIVDQYKQWIAGDERFYLYGHSAGGQFADRYATRHPDRVRALILSAPGRYAFPDPNAPWPYGQKEVTVRASRDGTPRIIRPDRDGWRKAAALPITVVVGTADVQPQPPRRDHVGTTRIDYAEHWVDAMRRIAPEGKSRIRLIIVPGIGHSSAGLTPACQKALAEYL